MTCSAILATTLMKTKSDGAEALLEREDGWGATALDRRDEGGAIRWEAASPAASVVSCPKESSPSSPSCISSLVSSELPPASANIALADEDIMMVGDGVYYRLKWTSLIYRRW